MDSSYNKIFTTNSIDYSTQLNHFQISTTDSLSGVKDADESVTITVQGDDLSGCSFKLYKKQGETTTLSSGTTTTFEIDVNDINGVGELYVDVYVDNVCVATTNALQYNITLNTFTLATTSNLQTSMLENQLIGLTVNAQNLNGYTFELYKRVLGVENLVKSSSVSTIMLMASELTGSGELFVKVYKNAT